MQLLIVGATGGVGQQVLQQALAASHEVTVAVRRPEQLPPTVRTVTVDLASADPDALAPALHGHDAVLSCLGPRSARDAGVAERGTRVIIRAMQTAGVERLVVVSAAPISTVPSPARPQPPRFDPGDDFLMRLLLGPLIKAALRPQYTDLARMEDAVRASGLAWTIVRPPRLTNAAFTGRYRTATDRNLPRGYAVARADVAHLMLQVLSRPDTIGHSLGVAN